MTARLLTIMGSGETAPTMVKVHRSVVAAAGSSPPGVFLDTPFGFQMNADELAARTVAYFTESVGAPLEVARARTANDLTGRHGDAVAARLAAAPFVFAGPGSPTYALHHWRGTVVPTILEEKLKLGGAVTFSSAAALTLGSFTVPVYEIYKVGEPPHWEPGLDLLRIVDRRLHAAVIPHFDNAEGGTHDTRFCYLGELRLRALQRELPDDAFVLGIDEHTALTLDLVARRAGVSGLGVVTLRVEDRAEVLPVGSDIDLDELLRTVDRLRQRVVATNAPAPGSTVVRSPHDPTVVAAVTSPVPGGASPLLRAARIQEQRFREAVVAGDAPGMVTAVLELEAELWRWRTDPTQSDEQDRVRATVRAMVAELGSIAQIGTRDPAEVVGPYVELAVALRSEARAGKRFDDADQLRQQLALLGVEVRDSAEGSTWVLRSGRLATPGCLSPISEPDGEGSC